MLNYNNSTCDYEIHNENQNKNQENLFQNLIYCYNCSKRICSACFTQHINTPNFQSHKYELLKEGIKKAHNKRDNIISDLVNKYPNLKGPTSKEGADYINGRINGYTKILNGLNNTFRKEYNKYNEKYKEFEKVKETLKDNVEKSNNDSLILMNLSNIYNSTNRLYNELVSQHKFLDDLYDITSNIQNKDNSNNNIKNNTNKSNSANHNKNVVFTKENNNSICLIGKDINNIRDRNNTIDKSANTDNSINTKDNNEYLNLKISAESRANDLSPMNLENDINNNNNDVNSNINNDTDKEKNKNMNTNNNEDGNNKNRLPLNTINQSNESKSQLTNKKMKRNENDQESNSNNNNINNEKDKQIEEQSLIQASNKRPKIYSENNSNQNSNTNTNLNKTNNNKMEEERKNNDNLNINPEKKNNLFSTLNSMNTSFNNFLINNNNDLSIQKSPKKAENPQYIYNIRAFQKLNGEIVREIIVLVSQNKEEHIVLKSFQSHQISHDKINIFSNKFPLEHCRLANHKNKAFVVGGKRTNDNGNNLCYKMCYIDNDANGGIGEIKCKLLRSTNFKHYCHSLLISEKYNIIFALSGINQTKCEYGIINANEDIDKWEEIPQLKAPRANCISFILNERYIYLIGGRETNEENFDVLDILSVFGTGRFVWKNIDYIGSDQYNKNLFRKKGAGIVVCDESVYIFGGYNNEVKEFMAWKMAFPDVYNLIIEKFDTKELPNESDGNSFYGQQIFEVCGDHYINIDIKGKLRYVKKRVFYKGFN